MIYYEVQHEVVYSELYGKPVSIIHIYDRKMSHSHPIAICYDIDVAEKIVSKCNKTC
jgi:hypothetical protein